MKRLIQILIVALFCYAGCDGCQDGSKGVSGDAGVDPVTIKRTYTYENSNNKTRQEIENGEFNYDKGAIKSLNVEHLRSNGDVILSIRFNEPGASGEWDAPDVGSPKKMYIKNVYDANGRVVQENRYNRYGDDKNWLTEDDKLSSYRKFVYDDENDVTYLLSVKNSGGTDWFDGDDFVDVFIKETTHRNVNNEKVVRQIFFLYSDTLENWSVDGGDIMQYVEERYDEDDNLVFRATFSDKGGDGKWFTEDDSTSYSYTKCEIDADTKRIILYDKGSDNVWLTADDSPKKYTEERFVNNLKTLQITYLDKGTGDWFDGDDNVNSYRSYTYDTDNNLISEVYYNDVNNDDQLFGKDYPNSSYFYYYNDEGKMNMKLSIWDNGSFDAFGSNGKWLDGDDIPDTVEIITYETIE